MRYYFDTEFIEYPYTVELLSIGIVAEDGREFYGESSEADLSRASFWVQQNVLPYVGNHMMDRADLAIAIRKFIGNDREPEFWAYNGVYDWVVFVWLFGNLSNFPRHWPRMHRELIEKMYRVDDAGYAVQLPNQRGQQHHALEDARWNKQVWEYLESQLNP